MNITYKVLSPKQVKETDLDNFKRYTQTTEVYVEENIELKYKEISFVDEWDLKRLREITKYFQTSNTIIVYAIHNKEVVGFTNVDLNGFKEYFNMPYIHVDNRYRNQKIGENLMLLISKIAKDNGADKLYISAHPDIRTIGFYKKMGCELTEYVNKELYEEEPYDIQLQRKLDYIDIMERKINLEFSYYDRLSSTIISKLLNKIHKLMPKDNKEYLEVCKHLIRYDERYRFSLGTLLLKKNKELIDRKYFNDYEQVLLNDIRYWGQVDQYCYRVLGPIMNNDYSLYDKLLEWSDDSNKDVRRASLVSMLNSSQKITCEYDFDKAIHIIEKLKNDEDFHVRKAVGWVLKCLYPTYPNKVLNYLTDNHKTLDRMIFRYALEHVEKEVKEKMMKL